MIYKPGSTTPPNARYPWHEWCDGDVHRLVEGVDYDNVNSIKGCARYQARRQNLKLKFIECGKTATLKFWRK